jgi:general secretion pathway protein J
MANGKRQRLNSRKGFTIVEMIVAMTLMSVVALIIAYGFYLGTDAWKRGERETGETQKLRVLSGLFYQQLKSAYPYQMDMDDEKVVLFEGESDSITFVTTLTDSSFGGFKWVRYSFENGTLLYKEGLLPDKEWDEKTEGKEKVVDTDLGSVEFSFYSADEEEWNESWDFGEYLPVAVKIRISYFQPFTISIPAGLRESEDNENEEII